MIIEGELIMNLMKYSTKREKVYQLLREEIIDGKLYPGERLVISNLAKKYDVSEIPVRESLQVLAQEGYVETAPHLGFVVSSMSKEDVREIYEIRINLEGLAARLAVQNMSNTNIESLKKIIDGSEVFLDSKDFKGYWEYNKNFHRSLYKYCSNNRLYEMIIGINEYSKRFPPYFTCVEEVKESIREHREIIAALNNRDEDLTEKLIRDHTKKSFDHVIQRIDDTRMELGK